MSFCYCSLLDSDWDFGIEVYSHLGKQSWVDGCCSNGCTVSGRGAASASFMKTSYFFKTEFKFKELVLNFKITTYMIIQPFWLDGCCYCPESLCLCSSCRWTTPRMCMPSQWEHPPTRPVWNGDWMRNSIESPRRVSLKWWWSSKCSNWTMKPWSR